MHYIGMDCHISNLDLLLTSGCLPSGKTEFLIPFSFSTKYTI